MSEIGNDKGGMEMIGRLLASAGGKVGRMAGVKSTGGAQEDFARLMAAAQGKLHAGQAAPSRGQSAAAGDGPGAPPLSSDIKSALAGLADQIARLRERLADGATQHAPAGQTPSDGGRGTSLDQLVARLSGQEGGPGRSGLQVGEGKTGPVDGEPRRHGADAPHMAGERAPGARGELGADQPPVTSPAALDDEMGNRAASPEDAGGETLARELDGVAEALADWRKTLDQGEQPSGEALAALRDRLESLRDELQGQRVSEQAPGLMGQLQALQQLVGRDAVDAAAGRVGGESRGWSDWSWRQAGDGRVAKAGVEVAPSAFRPAADGGSNSDWTGGPITTALGLDPRAPTDSPLRERAAPTHWSSLAGLASRPEAADADPATSPSGLGAAVGGSLSHPGGSSASSGVFTGQAATPPPNPQMPAQLGQQIHWMVGKGLSRANIELRPADLGPLKISIETHGDETRIALTATNPTTQGLLEQQLPRLREWLQDAGLAHSEVNVALGQEGDFGQQLADSGEGRGGGEHAMSGEADDGALASAAGPEGGGASAEWVQGRGVLDLFA